MRKTRVDLEHLLEDLANAFPGSLEETILIELAATALASGASRIAVHPDAHARLLTVRDDGRGMTRRDLIRCHSLAGAGRPRTERVFTGAGIRLALLLAGEVITETRRGPRHVATSWHLATRYRAPWQWIVPPGLTGERGTAVRLHLSNPLSPLLDAGYIEEALRTHFAALLGPACAPLLRRLYPDGVAFDINGQRVAEASRTSERVAIPVRIGRRRAPSAVACMEKHVHPVPEDQQGIAISAGGRVVKRGWDWLGLSPASAWRVTGLVEAPALAACLTPDRRDFVRTGSLGATYVSYRKALQQVVSHQLTAWGDSHEPNVSRRATPLERDVRAVVERLARDFPALRPMVAARELGHHNAPGTDDEPGDVLAPLFAGLNVTGSATASANDRKPARTRLTVRHESRAADPELGRFADGIVWVNDAHPAFLRAKAARAAGYHTALAVALALAPCAAPSQERTFVTQFMVHWGKARGARQTARQRIAR